MRYTARYTRRYTGRRKRRLNGKGIALIAALAAALYVALAIGTGAWVHGKLFGSDEPVQTETTEDEATDTEAKPQQQSAQSVTETVAFPAMESYALCVNAQGEAEKQKMKLRGGAGFPHKANDVECLLLAAYDSRSACESVAQTLRSEENMDTSVLMIGADAVELRLTALPRRIDGVREVFSLWQQTVQHVGLLWQDLDGGVITAQQALSRLEERRDGLKTACESAFEDALISGRSDALDGLYGVVEATLEEMDALLLNTPQNVLEVSSGIKYTGIRALTEYQSYVESLKAELT